MKLRITKNYWLCALALTSLIPFRLLAEQSPQAIRLTLIDHDSIKICKAVVTSADAKPVKGVQVNFYIKRSVGLLPIAILQKTDESGEVAANFPIGIPGDTLGNVMVVARLEDDDAILDQKVIAWGTKIKYETNFSQKALWASRSHAPTYLIIISNTIIFGIWGTMGYVVWMLFFRMKKSGMNYNPVNHDSI